MKEKLKLWIYFNWNHLFALVLTAIAIAYLLGMLACTNTTTHTVKVIETNKELLQKLSMEETDRFIYYTDKFLGAKNLDTMRMYGDSVGMSYYMYNKIFHKLYK